MGGPKKSDQMVSQNQSYIQNQGGALSEDARAAEEYYMRRHQAGRDNAATQYDDVLWRGGGGYTPEQEDAIRNTAGLEGLRTSEADFNANFLTSDERAGITGDQGGIRNALGMVDEAVDPASVADYISRTRLTPEQQQQMVTADTRSSTSVDQAAIQHNAEAARAAGLDPLGIAGYTDRASRGARINAGNAASMGRVNAMGIAADRENRILSAEQMLAAQRAGAAQSHLGAETGIEANAAGRASDIATNRQMIGRDNLATRYNQGQYIEGQMSGRAAGVAETKRLDQAEGRNYLVSQATQDANLAQQARTQGIGIYGTQSGATIGNTQAQIESERRPKWWEQLLSAGGQVGAAYAGKPA